MNPAFMELNGKRYIVPYWIEVDDSVNFSNISDFIPKDKNGSPNIQCYPVDGKPYTITVYNGRVACDCMGYKFRNKCKHTTAFKEKNNV